MELIICQVCNNRDIYKDDNYCKICGNIIANYCDSTKCHNRRLDHDARYCTVCGSKSVYLSKGIIKEWNS